jgi:cell division protein FtsN
LFITGGTYLNAGNPLLHNNRREPGRNPLTISRLNGKNVTDPGYFFSEDTVKTIKSDTVKMIAAQSYKFTIPERLAKTQINFRINSAINYLSFDHFVRNESKRMFFQAWLKENELKRLLVQTDSLRNVYANISSGQKEEISSQILQTEQKSIALNQEIPRMYENARDEEDRYWQSASADEIAKFQEKIRIYKDSIQHLAATQNTQKATIHPEISDTLILYKSSPKTTETKTAESAEIVYKIQVGAYKNKMPEVANKLIKKLSLLRKVEKHIDDKGVTILTTGNLKSYQDAVTMLNQVKQEGIKNATITTYQNGKKITVNGARK